MWLEVFGAFKVLAGRTGGPDVTMVRSVRGVVFSVPERNHLVHVFPVRDLEVQHKAPEFLPEVERTPGLFAGLSEQPAASLLDLVDKEGQHHEAGEDSREVFVAVSKIVFEIVPSVLEASFMMRPFSTLRTGHGH